MNALRRTYRTALAVTLTAPGRWFLRYHQPVMFNGRVLCSPRLHHEAVDYPCPDAEKAAADVNAIWARHAPEDTLP